MRSERSALVHLGIPHSPCAERIEVVRGVYCNASFTDRGFLTVSL